MPSSPFSHCLVDIILTQMSQPASVCLSLFLSLSLASLPLFCSLSVTSLLVCCKLFFFLLHSISVASFCHPLSRLNLSPICSRRSFTSFHFFVELPDCDPSLMLAVLLFLLHPPPSFFCAFLTLSCSLSSQGKREILCQLSASSSAPHSA